MGWDVEEEELSKRLRWGKLAAVIYSSLYGVTFVLNCIMLALYFSFDPDPSSPIDWGWYMVRNHTIPGALAFIILLPLLLNIANIFLLHGIHERKSWPLYIWLTWSFLLALLLLPLILLHEIDVVDLGDLSWDLNLFKFWLIPFSFAQYRIPLFLEFLIPFLLTVLQLSYLVTIPLIIVLAKSLSRLLDLYRHPGNPQNDGHGNWTWSQLHPL